MLHRFTVDETAYGLLNYLFSLPVLKNNFALAGGTSLSLQIGHRKSIDLDIFCTQQFDTKELEIILSSNPEFLFNYTHSNQRMLFSFINNIKCDFVHEPAALIQPFLQYDDIKYFSIPDIAAMKMHTICGRGKRKDFFDIYCLLQLYSWQEMLGWFGKKYGDTQFYYLWRSISYFADAEEDVAIQGIPPFDKSWPEIKSFILKACTQ